MGYSRHLVRVGMSVNKTSFHFCNKKIILDIIKQDSIKETETNPGKQEWEVKTGLLPEIQPE